MPYSVHDLQCVLQNEDLLSYVYLAYDDGYFIIGKDEDIGENDNPRLITLEKDEQQYSTVALPEAVRYEMGKHTVSFALNDDVASALCAERELVFVLPDDADTVLMAQVLAYVFSEQ